MNEASTHRQESAVRAVEAVLETAEFGTQDSLHILRVVAEKLPVADDDRQAAFERVRLRSIGIEEEILNEEGGALSDAEFARKLGLRSRETVRRYRESGRIFAIEKGTRNLRYPAWQVYKRQLLPGLFDVLKTLREKDEGPYGIAIYFLAESDELDGKRPLDLLRDNRVAEVVAHAQRYGDIGA